MADNFTELSTHDLWIAARQFDIDLTRPTPTTLLITITRPLATTPGHVASIIDGAVVTLNTKALTPNGYPQDGTQYPNASLVWGDLSADKIDTGQVVAFYSEILARQWPAGTVSADGTTETFSITITGTDADTIYYASIHGCTSVLQYYPIGIQSYPLEASRVEKDSSSYAGSIPSLPSAPTSPTPGMVYFDQQLNLVQYWSASQNAWVPSRTDQILSGTINPGLLGQTYMISGSQNLRIFNGTEWVDGTSANVQLRQGLSWIPMGVCSQVTVLPTSPGLGDMVYNYTSERIQYWDGTAWQIPTPSTTLFDNGTLIPAFTTQFTLEPENLVTPYEGLMFYNTSLRQLNVFNGSTWERANTAQHGTATTDKIGIGNDGSYDERLRLINIIKTQLGWPTQCVELTEEHFNIGIDNALDTYRQLSPGAYETRFMIFRLRHDQMVYHLNSPQDRTDAIVSVIKINRLNLFGVTGSGADNTWGQAFAQQFYNYAGGGGDLLSVHLVYAWSEEFQRIFAGDLPFVWNEARRELTLKRAVRQDERVVLEVELERTEQEILLDRWCKQFIQNWALAECKEVLGLIRSKYSSGTPGPAGTITLNGETLLAEARQDFTELKEALLNFEYQNAEHGNTSFLIA